MNKNSIMILLVIVLFGASGAVLYFGLFRNDGGASIAAIESNQKNIIDLMPYGESLNFDIVTKRPNASAPYQYKQVTSGDVGKQASDLFRNLEAGGESVPVGTAGSSAR